jgi:hypothetical protein
MDYNFFQLLSDRIERGRGDGRARLIQLRDQLLEMTSEYDKQMEVRAAQSKQLLEAILQAPDITEATTQSMQAIDDFFIQTLNSEIDNARRTGDLEKISKLQKVNNVIEKASAPPPEVALIQELLETADDAAMKVELNKHRQEITPEFLDTLTSVLSQVQSSEEKDLAIRIEALYNMALRISMEKNLLG